jgi:allantoicase
MIDTSTGTQFPGLIDLAAERLGGEALLASDEFFAEKENLLKEGRGIFLPDEYTDRGKWMDGWEPRRRRAPGHDWCIIKLGVPGVIRGINVDTNHFLGNHPPFASVDACFAPDAHTDTLRDETTWTPLVTSMALKAGSENLAVAESDEPWTHVRLNIYPAGGVARFRAWGSPSKQAAHHNGDLKNLAALETGALALCCSDMFFSPMNNLLEPRPANHMGQGWETRRSRPPTDDWVVIQLGHAGLLDHIVVDTAFFKGNYPDRCTIQGMYWPDAPPWALLRHTDWEPITDETPLGADQAHVLPVIASGPWTHIRLYIVPDGGVSRLRVMGRTTEDTPGQADPLIQYLNGLTEDEATSRFRQCCGAERWARAMAKARPFGSRTALFGEADRLWWHLGDGDWLSAFDHHPRIGADVDKLREKFAGTADLSEQEQAGVVNADQDTLVHLATANVEYEVKFGHIFIVCATGKTAEEMLNIVRTRQGNEPPYELRIAAGEQAKITRLRLEGLEPEKQ